MTWLTKDPGKIRLALERELGIVPIDPTDYTCGVCGEAPARGCVGFFPSDRDLTLWCCQACYRDRLMMRPVGHQWTEEEKRMAREQEFLRQERWVVSGPAMGAPQAYFHEKTARKMAGAIKDAKDPGVRVEHQVKTDSGWVEKKQ